MRNTSYKMIPQQILAAGIIVAILSAFLVMGLAPDEHLKGKSLIGRILAQREAVQGKVKAVTLNHLLPSFDFMIELSRISPVDLPQQRQLSLLKYLDYYQKIAEYFPDSADGFALLGFCYYYLGQTDQAITHLSQANHLNPQFFWTRYNLGVVYYRNKQFAEAVAAFKEAVELKPQTTLKILYSSKVYRQILASDPIAGQPDVTSLKQAYQRSFIYMSSSLSALDRRDEAAHIQSLVMSMDEQSGRGEMLADDSGLKIY